MRMILGLLLLGYCLKAGAQNRYDHELQLTETRFALESQIHGLKWGFLHNMDTTALGINNQGFVSLYKVWKDRPEQTSFLLQWKPTALWWSEDGLFGLTTGPYFTQAAKDSAVLATGYFFTIWKRAHTGVPFKFVVDAGMPMSTGVVPTAFVSTPVVKEVIAKAKTAGKTPTSFPTVSAAPTEAFRKKAAGESLGQALKSYTHEKSFLLVSEYGKLSLDELDKVIALNKKLSFQKNSSKDLSSDCYYEWGQFRSTDTTSTDALTGYYVHVWQVRNQRPLLLAAVYKFDQTLKK